jgi:hypothetical protein
MIKIKWFDGSEQEDSSWEAILNQLAEKQWGKRPYSQVETMNAIGTRLRTLFGFHVPATGDPEAFFRSLVKLKVITIVREEV